VGDKGGVPAAQVAEPLGPGAVVLTVRGVCLWLRMTRWLSGVGETTTAVLGRVAPAPNPYNAAWQ
jgi:hypothetical protein